MFGNGSWRWGGSSLGLGCLALTAVACSIDAREPEAPGSEAGAGAQMASAGSGDGSVAGTVAGGGAGALAAGASGATAEGSGGSGSSSAAGSGGGLGVGTTEGVGGYGGAGGSVSDGAGASVGGSEGSVGGSAGSNGVGGSDGVGSSACPTNLLVNGDFEAGSEGWVSFTTGDDPLVYDSTPADYEGVEAHNGIRLGWLGGVPNETNRLSQAVSVPANATRLGLRYSLRVQIFEAHATIDFLRLRLVIGGQSIPIAEFSNADAGEEWLELAPEPLTITTGGQIVTATLELESQIGDGPGTNFYLDDLALVPTCAP